MEIAAKIITILERCKKEIQAAMAAGGVNASGRTSASLKVETYAGGVRLVSRGEKVAPFQSVETGSPAGVRPAGFYEIIYQWSIDKKINFPSDSDRRSFAWFVSQEIQAHGTIRYNTPRKDIYTPAVAQAVREISEVTRTEAAKIITIK